MPGDPLPPAAAGVLERIRRDPSAPLVVAVVGPGGTGKSAVLDAVAAAYAAAGVPVLRSAGGRPLPDVPAETAVLVDDAHRLGADDLARLPAVAATGRLLLAHRPWPRPPGLTALVAGLGGRRTVVVTHHLNRATVAGRMARQLGVTPPDGMVELVHEQSGGLPALVDVVTRALQGTGRFVADRPDRFRRPDRVSVSVALAERLRHQVDALDPDVATLLEAMATGAALDAGVLGPLLDRRPAELAGTVEAARATGLLSENGELIPFVRSLFLRLTPVLRSRELQQRLAGLELDRGGSVLVAARQLLGTGASGARIAAILRAAADEALPVDAALTADLLAAAVDAGAPAGELAGRRARAAALTGDLDLALRLADEVLTDRGRGSAGPDADDRVTAGLAAAVALGARGLGRRGAAIVRGSGPREALLAVPALVATGDIEAAQDVVAAARATPAPVASLVDGAAELTAEALLGTVGGAGAAALSRLTRAAALLEPVAATALLPDGPAALAAVVALHCGEPAVAEGVLRRALAAGDGGRPGRTRHRLLLAAVDLGRGRADRVRHTLDGLGDRVEPRDELSAAALEVGLARRRGDVAALGTAWARARDAIVRHPVDLFTLLPLGELLVGAAQLGEQDRLAGALAEADELLDRLGRPALWAAPLEWSRLQAALVLQDPAGVPAHTSALATLAAARPCPHARLLADAARAWSAAAGAAPVDPPAVTAVARRMVPAGLGWEAAQLAAWSAAVVPERRGAADLLALARALQGVAEQPTGPEGARSPEPHAAPAADPVAVFSDRELEIGRHILDGLTYKQIGQRLYISAKTVEHHVARMRQRLGVASREELFGLLRVALDTRATPTSGRPG